MTNKVLLSLDLSTTKTGWSKIDLNSRALADYGDIVPRVKNPTKNKIPRYGYPIIQLIKILDICDQILELITPEVEIIIIEEVCKHRARLTGKVLDGLHFILLDKMSLESIKKVKFIDVSDWRQKLGLRLSEEDKKINKDIRKFNKTASKKEQKKVINWKTLSCRYVNARYGLNLEEKKDSDKADSICIGTAYIDFMV
jgi:hypothetical protein